MGMGFEILQENMPRPQVRTHPRQMGDQTDRSAKNNAVPTAENPYNVLVVFFNERVHGILLEIGWQADTQPAYQGWMPSSFQRLRMILWFRPSAQPKGRAVQIFGHRRLSLQVALGGSLNSAGVGDGWAHDEAPAARHAAKSTIPKPTLRCGLRPPPMQARIFSRTRANRLIFGGARR